MTSDDDVQVEATLASTLDTLDDAVNYRDWILSFCRPHLAEPILEIGAGHGTFTEEFARVGSVRALEPDPHGVQLLLARFGSRSDVVVQHGVVSDVEADASFGSAVMINVLEHIEDDRAALVQIRDRLADDGRLVIWVPAFMLLFSDFDRRLGHHRRYRKPQLIDVVEHAGFRVIEARYVNAPGWVSWLLITRLLKKEPTSGRLVSLFDRFVVPGVRRLESAISMPFGQSIVLVAEPGERG